METRKEIPFFERTLINPEERRLRTGWRLVGQFGLYLIFGLAALILLFPLIPDQGAYLLLEEFIRMLAIAIPVYLARRFLDRRSFISLGLIWNRRASRDLLAGFAIGGVSISLLFLTFWLLGWLKIDGFAWQSQSIGPILIGLLIVLLINLMVGFSEELLARGYWFQNLEEGLNLPVAVVITSLLFSLNHFGNPGFSWMAFFGLFVGGFDLAYGYTRTRKLWLPIGLHMGWNFFEGAVFGFQVSGMGEGVSLISQNVNGPVLWTGGGFGPEEGLVMVGAVIVNICFIYLYTHHIRE